MVVVAYIAERSKQIATQGRIIADAKVFGIMHIRFNRTNNK